MSNLIILIGVALLAGGIYTYLRQRAFLAQSILTEGAVVELLPQRAMGEYALKRTARGLRLEKKYLHRPLVRFKTLTGHTI